MIPNINSPPFHVFSKMIYTLSLLVVVGIVTVTGHPHPQNPDSSSVLLTHGGIVLIGPDQIPGEPLSPSDFQNADALRKHTPFNPPSLLSDNIGSFV